MEERQENRVPLQHLFNLRVVVAPDTRVGLGARPLDDLVEFGIAAERPVDPVLRVEQRIVE